MALWQEQVVEKCSGQIGNVLEGQGYIHATHQEMSKFDSALETGYKRVADVIEDFVAAAVEAVESKRLPRSILVTGKHTSILNTNFHNLPLLVEGLCWRYCKMLICWP